MNEVRPLSMLQTVSSRWSSSSCSSIGQFYCGMLDGINRKSMWYNPKRLFIFHVSSDILLTVMRGQCRWWTSHTMPPSNLLVVLNICRGLSEVSPVHSEYFPLCWDWWSCCLSFILNLRSLGETRSWIISLCQAWWACRFFRFSFQRHLTHCGQSRKKMARLW